MRLFVWFVGLLQVQATKYVNVTYDSDIIDKIGFKKDSKKDFLIEVTLNSGHTSIQRNSDIEQKYFYEPNESLESILGKNFELLGNY